MIGKRMLAGRPGASRRMGRYGVHVVALLALSSVPVSVSGQSWVRDFVVTAGLTGEAWWGDFSAITVPQFDSTESAVAGVGHWSARGVFDLFNGATRRLEATLDGGIRQSAAAGFQLRNYAPREQSGRLSIIYTDAVGGGGLTAEATARSRRVIDRPPMPLYKPPGYDIYSLRARYTRSVRAINLDVNVAGEQADYKPPPLLDHLDYLDRNSMIVEVGGTRVFYLAEDAEDYENPRGYWAFRLFGGYGYYSYPRQGEGVQRVDHAPRLGLTFEMTAGQLELNVTMAGTRNYSTSRRVEYRHGRVQLRAVWWWENTDLSVTGTLARKRYIQPGQDALVPGEEADNASVLNAELTRRLGSRVDGAFQVEWGKVETNFSGAFYTRFRSGFSLRVRPWD